jgi:hypothetical protein
MTPPLARAHRLEFPALIAMMDCLQHYVLIRRNAPGSPR